MGECTMARWAPVRLELRAGGSYVLPGPGICLPTPAQDHSGYQGSCWKSKGLLESGDEGQLGHSFKSVNSSW